MVVGDLRIDVRPSYVHFKMIYDKTKTILQLHAFQHSEFISFDLWFSYQCDHFLKINTRQSLTFNIFDCKIDLRPNFACVTVALVKGPSFRLSHDCLTTASRHLRHPVSPCTTGERNCDDT